MQTTAESERWEQKKSKLISRLSSYRSLKLVKKVKNAQRSGPLEISGKNRGKIGEKDIRQSCLGMLYNANTAESKRWEQKKSKLISRLSSYRSLKLVKKVKNAQRSGPLEISGKNRGKIGEKDITQSCLGMLYNENTAESKRWEQKKGKLISRLSSYRSLKLVKKVKNAQRSGPLEISGKFRGKIGEKDITQSCLGMLYNANTAESKRWEQKKSKLISRLSSYRSLKLVKKVKGRDLWKFRGNFGEKSGKKT